MSAAIQPFVIDIAEEVLEDLALRLRATRWPPPAPDEPWRQGTDLAYLKELVRHWADLFDWQAQERRLNDFAHRQVDLDGVRIHFVHERAEDGAGIPLILTHGWPSSFLEYLPLVPFLTDPANHGIDGPAFDLVIPSLPGYTFSERPLRPGVTSRDVAGIWHRLMGTLGYDRYGAGGGDFGSAVSTYMALEHPGSVIGLHLSNLDVAPYTGPGSSPLTDEERAFEEAWAEWTITESGYKAIQSTRPQTLGYALTDSPAGLAAWIVEKWRAWTDSRGDLESRISRDDLLTLLTLVWATGSITTSMRDYFDDRWYASALGPDDRVDVPTAIAGFTSSFVFEGDPPREWAARLYDVRRWTPMPRGGHFAPMEEPILLATDIVGFFGGL